MVAPTAAACMGDPPPPLYLPADVVRGGSERISSSPWHKQCRPAMEDCAEETRRDLVRKAFATHIAHLLECGWDEGREGAIGTWEGYLIRDGRIPPVDGSATGTLLPCTAEGIDAIDGAMKLVKYFYERKRLDAELRRIVAVDRGQTQSSGERRGKRRRTRVTGTDRASRTE